MKTAEDLQSRMSTRQDTSGRWHTVMSTPCEECGCPYDYSIDEPGLVWEAGDDIAESCLDPSCDCHLTPILGLRFKLHFAC